MKKSSAIKAPNLQVNLSTSKKFSGGRRSIYGQIVEFLDDTKKILSKKIRKIVDLDIVTLGFSGYFEMSFLEETKKWTVVIERLNEESPCVLLTVRCENAA